MDVSVDTCWAIDPQFNLKPDVDRVVLFTRPRPLSRDRATISRLVHPREAILLGLMDGRRTLREVGALWAELTGRHVGEGVADVLRVIDIYQTGTLAPHRVLVPVTDANRSTIHQYDVSGFVIDARHVNLRDNRLRSPYIIYYLPTLFCPQKCVYCYAKTVSHMETEPLSLDRLREILSELASLGVDVFQISGGEPFARRDIFELLRIVREAGLAVTLPTKLGVDAEQALWLREVGVDTIQVSLDSTVPAILDRMIGVEGHHARTLRTFEHLKRAGLRVVINCVLTPLNVLSIGALIDYLGGLGNVSNLTITPYGRSLFCHSDDLFVGQSEIDAVQAQIAARAPAWPHLHVNVGGLPATMVERKQNWQGRALCTANRHGFVILPDGRVTVCEELYDHPEYIIGDLKHQSVMDVWRSPRALALIHPDQEAVPDGACRTCGEFEVCHSGRGRCWRDVIKSYGWENAHYPDPRCPVAPPGQRLG